jgi:hypothetical protein
LATYYGDEPWTGAKEKSVKRICQTLALTLIASVSVAFNVPAALATAPASLNEPFTGATLFNPSNWTLSYANRTPDNHSGPSIPPCLTAASSTTTLNLAGGTSLSGCAASPIDTPGNGALILTGSAQNQSTSMLYNQKFPTSGGLDISFYQAQYGVDGNIPADGMSFFVKDGENTTDTVGAFGGGLGYEGVPGGLFGIGFDRYGNFTNSLDQPIPRETCLENTPAHVALGNGVRGGDLGAFAIAVRGPDTSATGDGSSGFCYLGGISAGADYFGNSTQSRSAAGRPVRIIVDPSTDASPQINVYTWKSGSPDQSLSTALKLTVAVPQKFKQTTYFKFGFASGTGQYFQTHAIWGLGVAPKVTTQLPTWFVVPDAVSVSAGSSPSYTYSIRTNATDPSTALNKTTLSNLSVTCTSSYTLTTTGPTTLPISCTGSVAFANLDTTATSILTVNQQALSLAPATQVLTGYVGDAISASATYIPTNFGGAPSYSIVPALPAGLTINPATGVITGTPTSVATGSYTVTASLGNLSATAAITLNYIVKPAVSLTPLVQTISGVVGTALTPSIAYTATGFTKTPIVYSILPALPAGLALNSATGVISGTSTTPIALQQFTVTANDGSSSATATVVILVTPTTVITKSLQPAAQSITGYVGIPLVPTATYVTTNFTKTPVYSIAPALPAGLTINSASGVITGTPVATLSTSNYEVTAASPVETATATVALQIVVAVTNLYAISFDPNGGQGTMTGLTGNAPTVTLPMNTITLPTFTFQGWKDDAGVSYTDGQSINITKNLTLVLHAQWKIKLDKVGNFDKPVPVVPGAVQPVSFALNSNKLSSLSMGVLKKWNLNSVAAITISGFAQPGGGVGYNLKLSKQRAQAAAAVMAKSYPGLKISVVGMGETLTKKCSPFKNKCAMITIMIMKNGAHA